MTNHDDADALIEHATDLVRSGETADHAMGFAAGYEAAVKALRLFAEEHLHGGKSTAIRAADYLAANNPTRKIV